MITCSTLSPLAAYSSADNSLGVKITTLSNTDNSILCRKLPLLVMLSPLPLLVKLSTNNGLYKKINQCMINLASIKSRDSNYLDTNYNCSKL